MSYDNKGKVSLWRNPTWEKGSSQPYVRGKVYAHRAIREGEEIEIALWVNDRGGERSPALTGKISDPRQRQEREQPRQEPAFHDDSEIPF